MSLLRKKLFNWVGAAALAVCSIVAVMPQQAKAASDVVVICAAACDDTGCVVVCVIFAD